MSLRNKQPYLYSILISGITGLITAYFIATTFNRNDLVTAFDWVIALSFLTFGTGFVYYIFLPPAWKKFNNVSRPAQYWGLLLVITSAISFSLGIGMLSLIPFFIIGFVLVSPALSSLQMLLEKGQALRFNFAWLLGGIASFFTAGFFQNFHTSPWEFILITVILNLVALPFFSIVIERFTSFAKNWSSKNFIPVFVLFPGLAFLFIIVGMLFQYPTLFEPSTIIPAPHLVTTFLGLTFLSPCWTAILLNKLDSTNWHSSHLIVWIRHNIPGLLVASAISASAYLLGTIFVSSSLGLADNYFDTDSPIWVNFLAASRDEVVSMRAVHPFVLMLLRPMVWLLSLLLNGDQFHAAILLNALVGGLCILMAWSFFKQRTNNTAFALIMASLLGLANSHLLLSAFLESYIFSAAALIASVILLQNKDVKLTHIIPVGLITFGITITNFIQTCIVFLLTQWNIKKTFKYVFITFALATVLTFAQTQLQPNSRAFYIPANLTSESPFRRELIGVPFSETISLANVLSRTLALSSVVAPRPFIALEEVGCRTPCFNTIRYYRGEYQYASYIGFGSWLARSWFLLLSIAVFIFIWNLFKKQKDMSLQAALALNILFNFVLHMNYGDDPMLYSPNWTYALIFFFGLSFEKFANKKWFQVGLLIFLTALLFNNVELFRKMLDAILPFYELLQ